MISNAGYDHCTCGRDDHYIRVISFSRQTVRDIPTVALVIISRFPDEFVYVSIYYLISWPFIPLILSFPVIFEIFT